MIVDGYLDEPAALGVPPYISPMVRAMAGAALNAGAKVDYISIDQIRSGTVLPKADMLAIIGGNSVPGRYLRTMPASINELEKIIESYSGFIILGGSATDSRLRDIVNVTAAGDIAAAIFDLIENGESDDRRRTLDEWNRWMILGADIVKKHRDYPQPLIADVETFRGCHRYLSGGCSFCIEPLKGKPLFREPEDIIAEIEILKKNGVRNVRLGGQTCIVSYRAEGEGVPRPNVDAVKELFKGLKALDLDVLHVDNGNPSVISSYPKESEEVLSIISECCTSGNVIALGMESADLDVVKANNLNSTPDQVLEAIRIINKVGCERGENGMPRLLPGINIIAGLEGESEHTYAKNLDLLRSVKDEGLLLRRINIRQVIDSRREYDVKVDRKRFQRFKEQVREEIDLSMLHEMLPFGTVLRNVYMELHQGALTFGRQIGSYPILVSVPYKLDLESFHDVAIIDWGFRSVTAIEFPFDINNAPLSAIAALPGIGKKRAATLFTRQPIQDIGHLRSIINDAKVTETLAPLLIFTSGKGK